MSGQGTNEHQGGTEAERTAKELLLAAQAGHAERVVALLDQGVAVDAADRKQNTALMRAAAQGRDEIVRILLERGAEVNGRNSDGRTPLMAAATYEPPEMVGHEIHDSSGRQAEASRPSRRKRKKQDIRAVVLRLLRAGADPQARDHAGRTALDIVNAHERHFVEPLPMVAFILGEAEQGLDRLDRIERGGKWTIGQIMGYILLLLGLGALSLYAILSKLHK